MAKPMSFETLVTIFLMATKSIALTLSINANALNLVTCTTFEFGVLNVEILEK